MIHEVFVPALSSTMIEGKIISWVKSPGEKVEVGETIVIIESDKADMDVGALQEGFFAAIVLPEGEVASVGTTIGFIAETEAEIAIAQEKAASGSASAPSVAASAPVAEPASPQPTAAVSAPTTAPVAPSGRVVISPRAKKLAKDLKVDLSTLRGSGPHGRVIAEDVQAAAGVVSPQPAATATPVAAPANGRQRPAAAPPIAASGEVTPLTTLQNAVVRNMMASLDIPDFHVSYTITTDALDQLYKQIKSKGVTMTALLAKAVALTLKKYPIMNACYVESGIQYHAQINIAIAVAMPGGGLITPVLKNADQIDIYTLSRTWKDLVERARAKQLQPDEYNSGTFSLSNLGMFGVDSFDAILTPGQGAIMAVGGSLPQVVATADGMMGVKQQMKVNITCDHRVIYGADAAAFLQDLAKLIETDPQSLTL
jgi:pyruvate dehydrogenase E2 component (dihydrolipoamide acetyltransferase)